MQTLDTSTDHKAHELNSSQQAAVEYKGEHLLIMAGPGTGKTHTITHRIAALFKNLIDTQNILAITFTNKAAEEMRLRLGNILKFDEQRIFVGTFHQFCLHILRLFSDMTQLPKDFVVQTPEQILDLTENIWPELSRKERKQWLNEISLWKSSGKDLEHHAVSELNSFLRCHGILDFDDLLVETIHLLEENWTIAHQMHLAYPYLFVDEYQDINFTQHKLLKLLVDTGVGITAIGDPNQSIYGFRGSDVGYFESFKEDFVSAAILSLSKNYRSSPNLLLASTQVIAANYSADVPSLSAHIMEKGQLVLHAAATERAEAEYVVHSIENLLGGTSMFSFDSGRVQNAREENISFGDIVILYRLNSQRFSIEQALDRSAMPYSVSISQADEADDEQCPHISEELNINVEKVSLMTLHAAKGLEFSVVFIVGCEQTLLPLNLGTLKSDVDEERRLFYVGMTRAKSHLYLLRASKRMLYGRIVQNSPSPFLSDIEEELKSFQESKVKHRKRDEQMKLF